jgi:hypothetical protein
VGSQYCSGTVTSNVCTSGTCSLHTIPVSRKIGPKVVVVVVFQGATGIAGFRLVKDTETGNSPTALGNASTGVKATAAAIVCSVC